MAEVDTEKARGSLDALRDLVGSLTYQAPEAHRQFQLLIAEELDTFVDAVGLVPVAEGPRAPLEPAAAVEDPATDAVRAQGPWRFRLLRQGKPAADGVEFSDGACCLHWRGPVRSVANYSSWEDLWSIHGHGPTQAVWLDVRPDDAFKRGRLDCYQDRCEGCPFASVGGLEQRPEMTPPRYVDVGDAPMYLRGYRSMAYELYGEDWMTCTFGWKRALTVE